MDTSAGRSPNSTNEASAAKATNDRECELVGGADQRARPHRHRRSDPFAVHLPYRERCVSAGDEQKDRCVVEAPQEPAVVGPSERRVAKQRRTSEHAEQRQEIDCAGQDQPRSSALCRKAEQERRCDHRQQQPERVDAAVQFEFPIGVVGLPAHETHVRLNALCPSSSSTFGLGRSHAIQTDLLRKLIDETPRRMFCKCSGDGGVASERIPLADRSAREITPSTSPDFDRDVRAGRRVGFSETLRLHQYRHSMAREVSGLPLGRGLAAPSVLRVNG